MANFDIFVKKLQTLANDRTTQDKDSPIHLHNGMHTMPFGFLISPPSIFEWAKDLITHYKKKGNTVKPILVKQFSSEKMDHK